MSVCMRGRCADMSKCDEKRSTLQHSEQRVYVERVFA